MTIRFYVPSTIPRFDETILSGGDGGIAENLGVDCWIDSAQAARHRRPAAFAARIDVMLRGHRGSGAENAQTQIQSAGGSPR